MLIVEGLALALALAAFLAAMVVEDRFQSYQPISFEIPEVDGPQLDTPQVASTPIVRAAAE